MKYQRICANKKCKRGPDETRTEFESDRKDKVCCCAQCASALSFEKNVRKEARRMYADFLRRKVTLQELDLELQLTANS